MILIKELIHLLPENKIINLINSIEDILSIIIKTEIIIIIEIMIIIKKKIKNEVRKKIEKEAEKMKENEVEIKAKIMKEENLEKIEINDIIIIIIIIRK